MVNIIRKYQQTLLIAITILVIVTFIWFWNGNMAGRSAGMGAGGEKVAAIYGQSITDSDVQRDVHKFQIAYALGLTDLVQALSGNAENQQQAVENFVWNSYVFDHEADALQVFPTDQEVQDELARIPGFQTDGRFDPVKLTDFVSTRLPSLGFTDSVIDELVRDQVRVRKVIALIGSTSDLSPAELKNRYIESNQKMDLMVVRLRTSDIEKSIPVSDADAKAEYDAHKESYRSEEARKVSVASFELSGTGEELKGKDRTDALQELGNHAWSFAQAVVDKGANFADQAKKYGAPVSSSAFFTASEPDPALAKIPALAADAFKLSSDYPSSDVLEGQNGYYVLHLEGAVPSKQLSFEEAKPKIVAQLQHERGTQIIQTRANDIRNQILAGLKTGKSFAEAAQAAGMTPETIPPFSLADASKVDVPDVQGILETSVSLGNGRLSEFIPTDAGGLFVYMKGREKVNGMEEMLGEMTAKDQYARQKQMGAFLEWMRFRKEAARLQLVQRT